MGKLKLELGLRMEQEHEFLKRSEVCQTPMNEPKYLRVLMEKEDLDFLRRFAFDEDTNVSEVVRVVMHSFIEQQKFAKRTEQTRNEAEKKITGKSCK